MDWNAAFQYEESIEQLLQLEHLNANQSAMIMKLTEENANQSAMIIKLTEENAKLIQKIASGGFDPPTFGL